MFPFILFFQFVLCSFCPSCLVFFFGTEQSWQFFLECPDLAFINHLILVFNFVLIVFTTLIFKCSDVIFFQFFFIVSN
jgi:hypothetical protein